MVPRKTVPGHMLRHLGLATSLAFVLVTTCACGADTSPTTSGSPIADGSPWLGALTPVALPAPVNSLTALDCPVASSCWAVGSTVGGAGAPNGAAVVATTDGGAKWGSQVIPPTVGYLSGISCSDQRHCTAVGQADQASNGQGAMITTSNGGATWTQSPTVPGILDVTTVSCRPDRRCIAIGAEATGMVALVSASPSSGWVQAGMLPAGASGATDISCSDDRHCWVTAHTPTDVDHVIGAVVMTTNGGGTWATITTPTGIGYLNGVSCLAGPTDGSGALPFTSSATAPTTAPVAGTPAATAAAIAPTTTTTTSFAGGTAPRGGPVGVAGARCTVVGTTASSAGGARTGHGLILTSTNGGARWTDQSVVATSASLMDVSCPAIGSCVAVGSAVVTSAQAGVAIFTGSTDHPWSNAAVVTSAQPLSAVSCLADSRCVVVGESTSEHLVGG